MLKRPHLPVDGCTLMLKGYCERCRSTGEIDATEEEYIAYWKGVNNRPKSQKEMDTIYTVGGIGIFALAIIIGLLIPGSIYIIQWILIIPLVAIGVILFIKSLFK